MASKRASRILNATRSKPIKMPSATPLGSPGYDNPRDDIERVKKMREGLCEKVPTLDNDIVNKLALDNAITARIAAGTAQGQLAYWDTALSQWIPAANLIFEDNRFLGIGTIDPNAPLHVERNLNGACRMRIQNNDTGANAAMQFIFSSDGNTRAMQLYQTATKLYTIRTALVDSKMAFLTGVGIEAMRIDGEQNVGIGTQTPTTKLSINEKAGISPIGGIMVKLTNKSGANSVAGQLVKADAATNDAVVLAAAGDVECFGVFLDDGVTDGSEAWVVVSGIADVALDDNVASVRGNWMATGVLAGYARTSASPAASPQHFEEIGHCIETVAAGGGGTHIKARCVLHFN